MALTGSYVALSKFLVLALPVFLVAWMRFGIAALAMANWIRRPAHEAPLPSHVKRLLFLESFVGNFLFTICMLYGVSLTSAVAAGSIMASIPAAVALMGWFFLGERVRPRVWIAVAFGVAGMLLLSLGKPQQGGAAAQGQWHWLGNLLVFGAVLCEAAYAVIGKKLSGSVSPKRISAIINLWGLALMTPMGLFLAWGFDFAGVPVEIWLLLVFYALAASVWTVWLWMNGVRGVPANQAGVFMVLLPISAALVGVVALGETLSGLQGLAFVIALAGVALATMPERA